MDAVAWLHDYARAWERGDAGVADLFTEDAVYRSHVFEPPHEGRAGIVAYWRRATATQRATRVRIGTPLVDGDRVVAEWWTTMDEDDGPVTLPGVLLLDFAGGRCRALREYWACAEGAHEPFDGWGEVAGGRDAIDDARAWADGYARAWRAGDAHAAAELYAEDVVYRSHAFRAPHEGRAAVREYTATAFASETQRDVRFGAPLVAGSTAAIEYWNAFAEEGAPKTLAGCVVMTFDDAGRCRTGRDYWHVTDERREPPPGWGWA